MGPLAHLEAFLDRVPVCFLSLRPQGNQEIPAAGTKLIRALPVQARKRGEMNLFDLPKILPADELFEPLLPDRGVLIERIISTGQVTPEGDWYDQERDEWVVLLQGEAAISYEDGRVLELRPGDCVLIPAHERHRVERTSSDPPCIWLAVHGRLVGGTLPEC